MGCDAAASLLGAWTSEIPTDRILAKVFVDDRLLISQDNNQLQESFHATQIWDAHHGFKTQAKTIAFGNNPKDTNLWWLDGYEVSRQKEVAYLGIPLPLQGSSMSSFFAPILRNCLVLLNKLVRSKISHDNAVTVVARKIIPALCYPSSAARPTKAQVDNLRSKIFEATSFRPCQTQVAHAVFCERTHQFDPESAMVYHNLTFWRRVYMQAPQIILQVKDFATHAMQCNRSLFGPYTILQRDVDWLDCELDIADGLLKHREFGQISFYEPDKEKFAHFIRMLIRQRHFSTLDAKHSKWQGIIHTDIEATTKLLRSLEPSSPYKNPLYRLLSDAHATPYRLHKMNIKQTPHCQFCLHEVGNIQHIVWDCPRFANLRAHWPSELLDRVSWPSCASCAMICTTQMPRPTRILWPKLQLHVIQLLWQWMELCRNPELYDQFAQHSITHTDTVSIAGNIFRSHNQQFSLGRAVCPISFKWNPPINRTSWNRWGSTSKDFALLFSFWTKWTNQAAVHATKIKTWTQALALFVQRGGSSASFLRDCQFVGMASYKFRLLTTYIFQNQGDNDDLSHLVVGHERQAKWLETFPPETAFPESLYFIPAWDLTKAASDLQAIRVDARLSDCVNSQVLRITPVQFCNAVGTVSASLMTIPLCKDWPVPRLSSKFRLPWVDQIFDLRSDCNQGVHKNIPCIIHVTLEKWNSMTAQEIRGALPPKPGPLKRFNAACKRLARFKVCLERFKQSQLLENDIRTHVLEPVWAPAEECACCKKLLNYSIEPRNLTRRCPKSHDIPVQTLDLWSQKYDAMLLLLQSICSKL